ncbi:MAG: WD40 repeat domain-containing protein [Saprospirales bacterium]|nr:WD40 repeat domain-containing protein [Saprospirales bacterium]
MLDGFNEITVEKTPLMVQLIEFVRRSKGVQIAVTSRYEMRNFEWTHGFNRLDLLALRPEQVEGYLEGKKLRLPGQADVQELLQNPMMLSLFTGSSQLARQFEGDDRFSFKAHVSSKGELLHNFIEGQLAKYWLDNTRNPHREEEFLWQAFLLRHLLPFLAWRMVEEGRFFIHSRKSLDPVFNFKSVVEEAYHYFGSFDFTDLFHVFEGKRKSLGFGLAENDFDAVEERNRSIRQFVVEKLFQLVEEGDTFRFLHQNFRDYFAAVHVQRTIEEANAFNRSLPENQRVFPEPLRKAPLDYFVRQMLGELEGEHTNQVEYDEQKWWHWSAGQFFLENNFSSLLETCRGVFDRSHLGYTVWNILTILKEKRGDFSGADLHELDFDRFSFNFLTNSRPGLFATFQNGVVDREGFFPQGHSNVVRSVAFNPNGDKIITTSDDETVKVWDANSGQCILTLQGHSDVVRSAVFNPNGDKIITTSDDKTAKVWDVNSGQCLSTFQCESASILIGAFHANRDRIITASNNNTAKIWDANSRQCIGTLQGHSAKVRSAAFNPNGDAIITASHDQTTKVWNAHSGQCILTLQNPSYGPMNGAFNPSKDKIVTASYDQTAKVWDANSGYVSSPLHGHSDRVSSAAFNPNGDKIITTSDDKTAKVWDVNSGECILTLQGHSSGVWSAAFNFHGDKLSPPLTIRQLGMGTLIQGNASSPCKVIQTRY